MAYLGYYAGDEFPIRQAASGGPYKMFFAPQRGGGCAVSYYRPSQAIARNITPGSQLMSGMGQLDLTDPTTLAVVGIAGAAVVYFLFKGGRKIGAARRRGRSRRAARLRAQAQVLEA
jgi:hypothetical protein